VGILGDWCGSPGGAAVEPDALDDIGAGIQGGVAVAVRLTNGAKYEFRSVFCQEVEEATPRLFGNDLIFSNQISFY
jgi:hypothetical protein